MNEQLAELSQTIDRLHESLRNEQQINKELQQRCNKQNEQIKILESNLHQAQEELDLSKRIVDDLGDRVNQLSLELHGQEGLGDK